MVLTTARTLCKSISINQEWVIRMSHVINMKRSAINVRSRSSRTLSVLIKSEIVIISRQKAGIVDALFITHVVLPHEDAEHHRYRYICCSIGHSEGNCRSLPQKTLRQLIINRRRGAYICLVQTTKLFFHEATVDQKMCCDNNTWAYNSTTVSVTHRL